ncbi:cbh [Scenedesmus sp. PABB004]|nr:cbh [Scenedesmus sp. PABB004]
MAAPRARRAGGSAAAAGAAAPAHGAAASRSLHSAAARALLVAALLLALAGERLAAGAHVVTGAAAAAARALTPAARRHRDRRAAAAGAPARACSSVSYADNSTVVSARTMDFANLPQLSISFVPSGSNNTLIPVHGVDGYSTLGRTYARKHSYVCVTPAIKPLLAAAAKVFPPLRKVNITNWPGVCSDGLNDAGLAVSLQWQLSTTGVPAYDPAQPGASINEGDVVSYILGSFSSVAELKAALDGGLSVSWNSLFSFAAKLALGRPFIPCHWGIWDKYNQSLVIEFSDKMNYYDNPVGVLTNNPLFPEQIGNMTQWLAKVSAPPYSAPPLTPTLHNTTFFPPPGSHNSSDRFTRLAVLKSVANLSPWRATLNPMSPGFVLSSPSNPALMAVLGLIQSVYLPKGAPRRARAPKDAQPAVAGASAGLRAAPRGAIANTPAWQVVRLATVDWAKLRAERKVASVLMLPRPWALDVSNIWGASLDRTEDIDATSYARMRTLHGAAARALLVAALLLALAGAPARACSSVSYADNATVVSARNMDFANLPQLSISFVPSGSNDTFIPVYGVDGYSTLGRTYARKHSYVCVTPAVKPFFAAAAKVFPPLRKVNITNWPGVCNDGINDAGLAVSLQWQLSTTGVPAYDPAQPGASINEGDVVSYILGSFSSVAELKAALDGGLSVSWNSLFSFAAKLAFGRPFIPCHWGIWDKYNQSLVIEFSDKMNYYDNPVGVLTNNPLFPEQIGNMTQWLAKVSAPPYSAPPLTPTLHNTTFFPPPGSHNSSDRFTRLAVLKSVANLSPWRATLNPMSPGFVLSSPSNPALMAVLGLIQSVYLPKGVDDAGGVGPAEADWTIYTTLRDHTNAVYYYRVANTPAWQVIRLADVDWAKLRAERKVASVLMLPRPWALDVTNIWAASLDRTDNIDAASYGRVRTALLRRNCGGHCPLGLLAGGAPAARDLI